jgi:UDP-N-acetylglucosamine--N-acetylmuramyl-(pentapeptide) pyrophosphoryl-undecaprenol N-acetylglucosamine transferase
MDKVIKVLIAAGGTGGHVMPAATVAGAIKEIQAETDFLFVGVGRKAEEDILAPLGYKRQILKVSPLVGRSPLKVLWALLGLFKSLIGAIAIVRNYQPDICLAFGGYVCGPVGLAAKIFGIPLVLHEQNSSPGLTNRWLGRLADLVLVGFPESVSKFNAKRVVWVGNPVRSEISNLASSRRVINQKEPLILVVGGSQGSRCLNLAVMDLAKNLHQGQTSFRLIHQTGPDMEYEVTKFYQSFGIKAQVKAFISDMALVYSQADLAITRAGALTLAELQAAKLPAVLVPLPTSAGDHQTANAQSLADQGLAQVVRESEIESGTLIQTVTALLAQPEKIQQMSDLAAPTASTLGSVGVSIASQVLELLAGAKQNENNENNSSGSVSLKSTNSKY